MRTSLNIVGGGAKGIVTFGSLKYIKEYNVPYDMMCGTSSGALNAALFAQGDIDVMEHMWLTIENSDVRTLAPWKLLFNGGCLYDSTPLLKTLQKYIDINKLRACLTPVWITVTDFQNCEPVRFKINHSELDVPLMLVASSSIPGGFPPVMGRYCDGGVMDDYNVDFSLAQGAERVIILHPSRPAPVKLNNPGNWNMNDSLEVLTSLPTWAQYLDMIKDFPNDDRLIVVMPPQPIPVSTLDFSYKGQDRKQLIKYGYDLAKAALGG